MRRIFAGAVCAAAFAFAGIGGASAAPLSGAGHQAAGNAQSMIVEVHGCHRNVRRGGAGLHRHVGRNCRRVAIHRHNHRGKRYWHRGARCSTQCVGIGPLRVCDRDCD